MSLRAAWWDRSGGDGAAPERVLIFTEHVNATYFISFEIPLAELARQRSIAWWTVASTTVQRELAATGLRDLLEVLATRARPTCVVLTRYALPAGPEILGFFRQRGVRCVYHLDDDLLGLSVALGEDVMARHGRADVVEARRTLVASADLVYASTRALADVLRAQFPRQSFVSGIYRAYDATSTTPAPRGAPVIIGYMGSRGHAEDFAMVVPSIAKLLRSHGDAIRFEFFGTIPFPAGLEPFRDRIRHHKANPDYFWFLDALRSLGWHIGLAPLQDHAFNRCKAPTKFIEYTEAGMTTIASDVALYREHVLADAAAPAGMLCGPDDWYDALESLAFDHELRRALVDRARVHCGQAFALGLLADQVARVLLSGVHVARTH